jgi:hypothetical protein
MSHTEIAMLDSDMRLFWHGTMLSQGLIVSSQWSLIRRVFRKGIAANKQVFLFH